MKDCCRSFLNEQFGGDETVVEEIYAEYRVSMGEKLAEIMLTADRRDWDALDRLAHAVKGNALAVGDTDMADTAISLRGAAKLADGERASACIERLKNLAAEI